MDDQTIDSCIEYGRPLELPPQPNVIYKAFTDASGGVAADTYTLGISHKDAEGLCILDVIRGTSGKFDPHQVTRDYAALCRDYRIR